MVEEFKPARQNRNDVAFSEIEALFERGDFHKAYRYCREGGYRLEMFSNSLAWMGRRMFRSRPGELMSLIHRYGIDVGYDIALLLRSQLELKDYHGFLKNVHRFQMYAGFVAEVQDAIGNLKRAEEAQSWRVKFEEMNSTE